MKNKTIYTRIASERARAFAVCTRITEENGKRRVLKAPLYPEGGEHLLQMAQISGKLKDQVKEIGLAINQHFMRADGTLELEYVTGISLQEKLDQLLLEGETEKAREMLEVYLKEVSSILERVPFERTEAFDALFPSVKKLPEALLASADVTDLDMVCENVIHTEKGPVLLDYEWTFDFPIPGKFVLYRILYYYLSAHPMRSVLGAEALYEAFGLFEDLEVYAAMEKDFQAYIMGRRIPLRVLHAEIAPDRMPAGEFSRDALQIFFAQEKPYREEDSVWIPMEAGAVCADLPIPKGTRFLRLDPGDQPCSVCLNLSIDGAGLSLDTAVISQGMRVGNWIYIAKTDPNIEDLPIPEGSGTLHIEIRVYPGSVQMLQKVIDEMQDGSIARETVSMQREQITQMENTKVWQAYSRYRNLREETMKKHLEMPLEVEQERFHIQDRRIYLLKGILPTNVSLDARLDGKKIEAKLVSEGRVVFPANEKSMEGMQAQAEVYLPEDLSGYKTLKVYACVGEERKLWFTASAARIDKVRKRVPYYIDEENLSEDFGVIRGWAVSDCPVEIRIYDKDKKPMKCRLSRFDHPGVCEQFSEFEVEKRCGFAIDVQPVPKDHMYLVFVDEKGRKSVHMVGISKVKKLQGKVSKTAVRGLTYLEANGIKSFRHAAQRKINRMRFRPMEYNTFLKMHIPDEAELKKQRALRLPNEPKISIVVPLYKTPRHYLDQMIRSVEQQSYENWELVLSDGSGENSPLTEALKAYEKKDPRIRVLHNERQLRIVENTNAAIEAASGNYIAFMDHDDTLAPHALFEVAKVISEDVLRTDVIYSDEDKMQDHGKSYLAPNFKPDYNPDFLRSVNYICHLFVVRRTLLDKVGYLRPEYEGAQDYDLILRCTQAAEKICHIPKILYHWRFHPDSTAENPESKLYAFEAGRRALQDHYDRIGVKAVVEQGEQLGLYRTHFIRSYDPLVSILIPNKDHIEDLERCISSIEERGTYKNIEYIIIENNSTEPETFEYYKKLEKENPKVHVVYWKGIFNYSAINNYGMSFARGEYLLLLNNDTEIINGDFLEEMLGYGMREDVGIVGARLFYDDDTIQHAGVIIGFGEVAGHAFIQQPKGSTGYQHRIICAQDYTAVTAACMLVRKSVYEEVGGLTEALQVAFNDVDFCLKVRKAGYLCVYNPYCMLHHYESKSRGLEDTPEKQQRFAREIATIQGRWPDVFGHPDPNYNPNLTRLSQDFSLMHLKEARCKDYAKRI